MSGQHQQQFPNYQLPNANTAGSAPYHTGGNGQSTGSTANNSIITADFKTAAVPYDNNQQYFPQQTNLVASHYAGTTNLVPESSQAYVGASSSVYEANISSPLSVQQPTAATGAPVVNYASSYLYPNQQLHQQQPLAPQPAVMRHPPAHLPQQPLQQYSPASGIDNNNYHANVPQNAYNNSVMPPSSAPTSGVPLPSMQQTQNSNMPTGYPPQAQQQQQQQHQQQRTQYGYNNAPQQYPASGIPSYGSPAHAQSLEGARAVNLLANRNILPPFGIEPPLPMVKHNFKNVICDPDIFRCTLTAIPRTSSLLDKTRLPFGILIHPFRDLSNLQVLSIKQIVRCRSCRTYINPWITFLDYTKWRCNVCSKQNDLPGDFSYDARTSQFSSPELRPEVTSATVEYIASAEYATRPPQPAVFLFLLDVSHYAVESGYITSFCRTIKHCLSRIPGDARRSISIIAFDSQLHFFSLTTGSAAADEQNQSEQQQEGQTASDAARGSGRWRELVVGDLDDIFIPDPTGLFVNIEENSEDLNRIFDFLPQRFADTRDTGVCAGAALQVACKMLQSIGGRITLFLASMPNIGPGILKLREDPNIRAGNEVKNLAPATDFYKALSLKCAMQHTGVDLFVMSGLYCDISTLSTICNTSAGAVHFYPGHSTKPPLQPVSHQFIKDLDRYLTRKVGFEAVLRIRCTHGVTMKDFSGNFFVRSTDLVVLPVVNPDAGYAFKMEHEESLMEHSAICFQAALLYTTSYGERRIRVHTLNIPVARNAEEVYAGADQEAIAAFVVRLGSRYACEERSMDDVRQGIMMCAEDALCSYASIAKPVHQQLLAPHSLRCLPLFLQAATKSIPFRSGISTALDLRSYAMQALRQSSISEILHWIYPSLYRVDQILIEIFIANQNSNSAESSEEEAGSAGTAEQNNSRHHNGGQPLSDGGDVTESDECDNGADDEGEDVAELPAFPQVQLSSEFLMADGIYLLEAAMHSILYIRHAVPAGLIERLLGVPSYEAIPPSPTLLGLPPYKLHGPSAPAAKSNVVQNTLIRFFNALRYDRRLGPTLEVITEGDRRREIFLQYLHDDRLAKAPSYVETLQSMSMHQTSS